MKSVAAGAFKTHCRALIDEVHDHGHEIIITKRGKPMARLVPVQETKPGSVLGCMKDRFRIIGDIVEPTVTP